ncbi:MAG: DMT family transporter [Planctomycetota bacterium]|nr:DMT family transporter [Planctomycetota bacterium]
MPSPAQVHLALITVSVLFGCHFVLTKRVLDAVPAPSWVLYRITAATCILVPLALCLRRRAPLPGRRAMLTLLVASFLGVTLNQILFTEGLLRTTPEHSAVVTAAIPTWTLLIAAAVGQEQLRGRSVLAVACALAGVLYLLGLDELLADGSFQRETLVGDLLTAANGVAFAAHLVMMRRIGRDLDPWTTVAILFVQGLLMITIWCGPQAEAAHAATTFSPPVLWFALYTILGATVLTYVLNTWALRHTQSSNVAIYINVQPLVAAGLNCALGAPLPDHRFFVALTLVGVGLWLQTSTTRPPAPP